MRTAREVLVHVRRDDEFLVARRTDHAYWHPVAGGVEPGEEWDAAAVRELREETGLVGAAVREIGAFEYVREPWEGDAGLHVLVRAFLAEAPPGWEPELNDEHDAYRWLPRDEAAELLFWPEPADLLRSLA